MVPVLLGAGTTWAPCVFSNARKLAIASRESAKAVASASFARCGQAERDYDAAWQARWGEKGAVAEMREGHTRRLALDIIVTICARLDRKAAE